MLDFSSLFLLVHFISALVGINPFGCDSAIMYGCIVETCSEKLLLPCLILSTHALANYVLSLCRVLLSSLFPLGISSEYQ